MSAVAAEAAGVIAADYQARYSGREWGPFRAATALDAVGLLRPDWATDEAKAVLDAAVAWAGSGAWGGWTGDALEVAVAAYVASLGGAS